VWTKVFFAGSMLDIRAGLKLEALKVMLNVGEMADSSAKGG